MIKSKYLADALAELIDKPKFVIIDGEFKWLDERDMPDEKLILEKIKEYEVKEKRRQIEDIASQKVRKILKEYDYDDRGDVAIWATKGILEKNPFYDEAVAIQKWIKQMDIKMYELQDRINVKNVDSINIDELTKEFPEFEGVAS